MRTRWPRKRTRTGTGWRATKGRWVDEVWFASICLGLSPPLPSTASSGAAVHTPRIESTLFFFVLSSLDRWSLRAVLSNRHRTNGALPPTSTPLSHLPPPVVQVELPDYLKTEAQKRRRRDTK